MGVRFLRKSNEIRHILNNIDIIMQSSRTKSCRTLSSTLLGLEGPIGFRLRCSFTGNSSLLTRCQILCNYQNQVLAFSTLLMKKTHYEILNVAKTASTDEIREAFIKLSKQWHPDRNTDDPSRHQKFVQINEAYSVLSKPLSRRDYDLSLDADRYVARQMNAAASRSHGYGYSSHAGPYYHYRDHMYDESFWSGEPHAPEGTNISVLMNFYMLIAVVTLCAVLSMLHYMHYYMPNPKLQHLRNDIPIQDIEKHDFIMQSEQEGVQVYYYAVPRKGSKEFDIVVLKKGEDSVKDTRTLHEVTRSSK